MTGRRPRLAAAALLAAAVAAPLAPAPRAAGDDWVTLKNESETVEITVPPDFKHLEIKNPARVIHIQYPTGEPWRSMQVKVYAHAKMHDLKGYMVFVQKDVGGENPTFVEGSATRFSVTRKNTGEGGDFVGYCDGRTETDYGYYVEIGVLQSVFEARREDFDKMLDSFKSKPAPKDSYSYPPGWQRVQNDWYAVIGPAGDLKEKAEKKALEDRLFRVQSWLDPLSPGMQMLRVFTGDKRRMVARLVVRVYPTREKFQQEAGDFYREDASVLYVPPHPDRPLLVDGSPESRLNLEELVGAAGAQYLETRMPTLEPWLREGLRRYFEYAAKRRNMPGLFPPEALKQVKELFAGSPPVFEELIYKDEAAFRALGENGVAAAWGYLQFGMHGPDKPAHVRDFFQRFVRGLVGAPDCGVPWEAALADYKTAAKRPLKLRDIDGLAKKFWKEFKE